MIDKTPVVVFNFEDANTVFFSSMGYLTVWGIRVEDNTAKLLHNLREASEFFEEEQKKDTTSLFQNKKERIQDLYGFSIDVDEAQTEAELNVAVKLLRENCKSKRIRAISKIDVTLLSEHEWNIFLQECMRKGLMDASEEE